MGFSVCMCMCWGMGIPCICSLRAVGTTVGMIYDEARPNLADISNSPNVTHAHIMPPLPPLTAAMDYIGRGGGSGQTRSGLVQVSDAQASSSNCWCCGCPPGASGTNENCGP